MADRATTDAAPLTVLSQDDMATAADTRQVSSLSALFLYFTAHSYTAVHVQCF